MSTLNQFHSYQLKELPRGCQYCIRGEKLVLFVTGICPRKCSFCPVSDEKYQQDVIFANERKINSTSDLLKEAELMQARGAGITGGDPLAKLNRTLEYIRLLKEKFGKQFHLHLYTSLDLVEENKLNELFKVGLDEIRFHLDLEDKKYWERLVLATNFSWDMGVEMPLIPGKEKEFKELIDFIADKISFLNLNELEVADNSHSSLLEQGFKVKDQLSYGVRGSLELGLDLLKYVEDKNYTLKVHLCTAKLKDAVQLANRLKREAKYSKNRFDLVDSEGMLIRGALYLEDLKPGFGYREKLNRLSVSDRKIILDRLKILLNSLKEKLSLKDEEIILDESKLRLLLAKRKAIQSKKEIMALGLVPAVVKEYPTADQLEIEVEFLG